MINQNKETSYIIGSLIGKGTQGDVYKGRFMKEEKEFFVAIKILKKKLFEIEKKKDRQA